MYSRRTQNYRGGDGWVFRNYFYPKLCRTIEIELAVNHDILLNTETIKDYIIQGKHDKIAELINETQMI